MKLTLKQKAGKANGQSRACSECIFARAFNTAICDVCIKAFNEGFAKGYKTHQKETNNKQKQE